MPFDPTRDLSLTRVLKATPAQIWAAWSSAEHLCRWFTPEPFKTTSAVVQLWPGGAFITRIEGPDGERGENEGCFLDVVKHRRIVFTDALGADFRPKASSFMTGCITLEEVPEGTRYLVEIRHADGDARGQHLDMGFEAGWGAAISQLEAVALTL